MLARGSWFKGWWERRAQQHIMFVPDEVYQKSKRFQAEAQSNLSNLQVHTGSQGSSPQSVQQAAAQLLQKSFR
jgi:hypothetical protein